MFFPVNVKYQRSQENIFIIFFITSLISKEFEFRFEIFNVASNMCLQLKFKNLKKMQSTTTRKKRKFLIHILLMPDQ